MIFEWRDGETILFPRRHLATADVSINLVQYEADSPKDKRFKSHAGVEFVIARKGHVRIDFEDSKNPDRKPLLLENERQFAVFDSSVPHRLVNPQKAEPGKDWSSCALIIRFLENRVALKEARETGRPGLLQPQL